MAKKAATTTTKPATTAKSDKQEKADKKSAEPVNPHADKAGRIPYPGLQVDEDGAPTVKLKEIPEDWETKKHQALKRAYFQEEWMFFEFKAQQFDAKAIEYRKESEESKALGNSEDRAKRKKALAMAKRLETLKAELEADGVDVESLLASVADSED